MRKLQKLPWTLEADALNHCFILLNQQLLFCFSLCSLLNQKLLFCFILCSLLDQSSVFTFLSLVFFFKLPNLGMQFCSF